MVISPPRIITAIRRVSGSARKDEICEASGRTVEEIVEKLTKINGGETWETLFSCKDANPLQGRASWRHYCYALGNVP